MVTSKFWDMSGKLYKSFKTLFFKVSFFLWYEKTLSFSYGIIFLYQNICMNMWCIYYCIIVLMPPLDPKPVAGLRPTGYRVQYEFIYFIFFIKKRGPKLKFLGFSWTASTRSHRKNQNDFFFNFLYIQIWMCSNFKFVLMWKQG